MTGVPGSDNGSRGATNEAWGATNDAGPLQRGKILAMWWKLYPSPVEVKKPAAVAEQNWWRDMAQLPLLQAGQVLVEHRHDRK